MREVAANWRLRERISVGLVLISAPTRSVVERVVVMNEASIDE